MAFTITDNELAVALRITTDPDTDPDAAIKTTLQFLIATAKAHILHYAPAAPDAVHDGSLVRLVGFLYDVDATDRVALNPLMNSGAASMLQPWRDHRIGVIGAADAILPPTPTPGGTVPEPPGDGYFILTSDDGALSWVAFPPPS